MPSLAEQALAELENPGDSRSLARNEETFGQILMSSRDPSNLNELFDEKDIIKKRTELMNLQVQSTSKEPQKDLEGETSKASRSKISTGNNSKPISRGQGSSGARGIEKGSKGGSSEQKGPSYSGKEQFLSKAPEAVKVSRDNDVDQEHKYESKPPLRTADNFYRTRAMQNPTASYAQALGATPQGTHITDRVRANSLNLTAGILQHKNSSIVHNQDGDRSAEFRRELYQPSSGLGGGLSVGGGRGIGSRENGSGSGRDRGLAGSREASRDGPRGIGGGLGRIDKAEVFSQQMSFDNFNSYANRVNSQIMLSQGGGGFARGTIFKGGKEWRVGGMAANANTNQGLSRTNFKARMGQGQRYFGDAHSQYVGGHPYVSTNVGGYSNNEAARRTQGVAQLQQIQIQSPGDELVLKQKTSDAGVSKASFATHKRGIPRTLWQRGAVFSTKMSRASVSAGKHIPQYHGPPGQSGGFAGGFNMTGIAPQFNMTQGTQGFYQQKYDQIAQQINYDIIQNQKQAALKIHSNMSESGAYGAVPNSATKTTVQARKKVLDELQRHKNAGSSSQLNIINGKGAQRAHQDMVMQEGNIEYSNSVFKTRPFSSENKYAKTQNQRNPNNRSGHNNQDVSPQYVGLDSTLLREGDHFRGREFFDKNVKLNIQGTINNVDLRRGDSQVKSPFNIESDRPRQDSGFVLPPINIKNDHEGIAKNLITEDVDLGRLDGQELGIEVDSSLSGGIVSPIPPLKARGLFSPMTNATGIPGKTNYEKKEERMLSQRLPEIVWLRVYHVTSLNKYLLEFLGFGFYHTSVELYNHEFAYGGHDFDFSGIVCVESAEDKTDDKEEAKKSTAASGGLELKERIPIGITYYSMDEIDDIVIYFGNFWHGHDYDPFSRNCNDFAQQFITHICDKEQYYYPSYINRFTKLGSILRGWFKPLQTIFGEIVELEQNEPEQDVDEWGYEIARDYVPVVGRAEPVAPSQPTQQSKQSKEGAEKHQTDSNPPAAPAPPSDYHEQKVGDSRIMTEINTQGGIQRQISVITSNQQPMVNDYNQQSPREVSKKHEIFSPSHQKFAESIALNKTDIKKQNVQLDALLSSPKQNIKVSQIMDITQQQRVKGSGQDNDFDAKSTGLNRQKSFQITKEIMEETKNLKEDRDSVEVTENKPQDDSNINTGGMLINNLTNFMEEPVENIKQRADEHFAHHQYQQAMKFYEICLGKITSVTDVDVNEDPYMMRLTIQTYLGICDSALGVGLPDRLVHFATQCIKVDVHNTSSEMHRVYKKRAQAYLNMGRYELARQDLENALHLAQSAPDIEGQIEQMSQITQELNLVKDKILAIEKSKEEKNKDEKAEASEKKNQDERDEEKEVDDGVSDLSFKSALDHIEDDADTPNLNREEEKQSGRLTGAQKLDDQETEINLHGPSNDPKDAVDGETEFPSIKSPLGSMAEQNKSNKKNAPVRHKSFTHDNERQNTDDDPSRNKLQDRSKTNSAFAHTAKKTMGNKTMPLDLEEANKVNKSGVPSKGKTARLKSNDFKQPLQGGDIDQVDDEDDKNTEEAKVDEQIVDTQGNDFGENEGYGHKLEF